MSDATLDAHHFKVYSGATCNVTNTTINADAIAFYEGSQYALSGNTLGGVCDPDFDNDGVVSIIDFNQWRIYSGQTVPPAPKHIDINGNGMVWIQDFNIWRIYYGRAPAPGIGD